MPHFAYIARDPRGARVEGVMEGASSAAVAERLAGSGAVPVDIRAARGAAANDGAAGGGGFSFGQGPAIAAVDVLLFFRQMHTLLKAGVPILRALAGLGESCASRRFAAVIRDLRDFLEAGHELSQGFARHGKVFSPFVVAMVRVGESTGRLEEVFLRLFHHLEFQKFMREQVKSALRYPAFVVAAMVIALAVINVFVIPSFARTFRGLNADLPLMTRVLIATSEFTVAWWPAILAGVAAAALAARAFVRTEHGGTLWDRLKLRIPVAGKIIRKATLARLARSLGLALKSGVSVAQALSLVQQVVENRYIAHKLEHMRLGVACGETVLRVAGQAGIFTPTVLQMIMVGEESGMLDELLEEVADLYQQDVEYELKSLSAQIEPILILVLGAIVLVLALGVFMPLWDLGRAMGGSH